MEIEAAIEEFIQHCRCERALSGKTLKAYGTDLSQFRNFMRDDVSVRLIEEVERDGLRDYLRRLGERYAPRTVRRKVATLKSFFTHMEFNDLVAINPLRKMRISIKEPRSLPRVISLQDVRRLFRHMYGKARSGMTSERRQDEAIRDAAVMEVLFATGMRVAELAGLTVNDVDLQRGSVRIMGKGNRERIVPLCNQQACDALQAYSARSARSESECKRFFVNRLGRPYSEQSVRFMIRKRVREAGIWCHVTPHMFRHTVATLLLGNGMDIRQIQHLLGHTSIATTQIYAHVDDRSHRRLLQQKHPRRQILAGLSGNGERDNSLSERDLEEEPMQDN